MPSTATPADQAAPRDNATHGNYRKQSYNDRATEIRGPGRNPHYAPSACSYVFVTFFDFRSSSSARLPSFSSSTSIVAAATALGKDDVEAPVAFVAKVFIVPPSEVDSHCALASSSTIRVVSARRTHRYTAVSDFVQSTSVPMMWKIGCSSCATGGGHGSASARFAKEGYHDVPVGERVKTTPTVTTWN